MCGIYGAVQLAGGPLRDPEGVRRMGELLLHRGPDGGGFTEQPGAALGARRLSIVDLSEDATQPFSSPDGGLWLVCNGEIYNAPELRTHYAAQGYRFRSQGSDVEPLVPLFLEYGEDAVERIDGMFALAVWDARQRRLILARDRAGEKPVFYCERAGEVRFASEIPVLLSLETRAPEVSSTGLADYLTLGYAVAPRTLFAGVEKLEAGHLLVAGPAGTRVRPYWDPVPFAARERAVSPEALLETFAAAVSRQVVADVPIGVFTSGGLDSSLLAVEAVRNLGAASTHTYAVQFDRASYDESSWAERVCGELGTPHHTVRADDAELARALEVICAGMAEPLGDPAILPTYLLSEAASADVKVVLSGEGADELFGGYPTYIGHLWAERWRRLPRPLRDGARSLVHRLPVTRRKVSLDFLARRFVDEAERDTGERHLAWFGALGPEGPTYATRAKRSEVAALWPRLDAIAHPVKRAMVFDLLTYLAENLLTKVDRATMLASVEARAPFLDPSVMELALGQPLSSALGLVQTKRALKRAALARLPREVVHRTKRGLSVPVADWINGALKDEVDRLLEPGRLRAQELLDPEGVGRLLAEHRQGRADHARKLWPLFMLQRWHERWIERG